MTHVPFENFGPRLSFWMIMMKMKMITVMVFVVISEFKLLYVNHILYIAILVGGLEHEVYFSIYWECHHPS